MTSNMDCESDHMTIHCSLKGMHWDSQQHTLLQVQWADMTLITSFSDGEDGDSLWNIRY
jgi:hypothetical protein